MNTSARFFRTTGLALGLAATALTPAWAASHQGGHGAHGAHGKPAAAPATEEMTDAEVRRVDKEGGKVTLRHAEIKSLDMPPMTMVFVVKDKEILGKLKAGDKIQFKALNEAGQFTANEIRLVR